MKTAPDEIRKFHTSDLALRIAFARTTELVRDLMEMQNLGPAAGIAVGRLVTGAVLMASQTKTGHRLGVRVSGDGPLGEVFAESSYEGESRGYCQHPQGVSLTEDGRLSIAKSVGNGTLTVTRNLPFQKTPHHGIVPIVSGEIGLDLAHYLEQSQQTRSAIALSVIQVPSAHPENQPADIQLAAGILIEVLPGAPDSVLSLLEKNIAESPPLSKLLESQAPISKVISDFIQVPNLTELEHPYRPKFYCHCTMERVERTLILLGRAAMAEMALKGEPVDVKCEFCSKKYTVTPQRVRELSKEHA